MAGNHDELLDPGKNPKDRSIREERERARESLQWGTVNYLQDTGTNVRVRGRDLNVYGSPRSPRQGNGAFQYYRCDDEWKGGIPPGLDILITHGPPKTHLDANRIGCLALLEELWRTRPRLHVCGHVHQPGGWVEHLALDGHSMTSSRK